MKLNYENIGNTKEEKIMREHIEPKLVTPTTDGRRHIPPHERKNMLQIQFDEKDMKLFCKIFGDVDTANAAVDIICNAPPEIKILSVQLLKMIEEADAT